MLDLWDDCFAVDFIALRKELNRISRENLSFVRSSRLTLGLNAFSTWYENDEDEMIYPIDDDDYFHPALATTAPHPDDGTAIVFWPHIAYTYDDRGSPILIQRSLRTLLSNNWGVRKSFLREHFTEEEAREILADHARAAVEIAKRLGTRRPERDENWWDVDIQSPQAQFLPESYSVSLVHVGSLLRVKAALDSDREPVGVFARNMGKPFSHFHVEESAEIPSELGWTEPWIRQAERIFKDLRRLRQRPAD